MYKNKLDKACFSHDAVYSDKDFAKRTIADRILKYRIYEITLNPLNFIYEITIKRISKHGLSVF